MVFAHVEPAMFTERKKRLKRKIENRPSVLDRCPQMSTTSGDLYRNSSDALYPYELITTNNLTVTEQIEGGAVVKTGGLSNQFLKANGTTDNNIYSLRKFVRNSPAVSYILTPGQTNICTSVIGSLNIIKCSNNDDFERYEPLINLSIDLLKNIANNKELLKDLVSKSECFKYCIN